MNIKIFTVLLFLFVILGGGFISANSEPVKVQRELRNNQGGNVSKFQVQSGNQSVKKNNSSQQKTEQVKKKDLLTDVQKKCSNYVKYKLNQTDKQRNETWSDHCKLKYQLEEMGAELTNEEMFATSKSQHVTVGGRTYFNVKLCYKVNYTYKNKSYETGICK